MDKSKQNIRGFVKISDVTEKNNPQILVQKENAIHYENFSQALANSVTNRATGYIEEMHFGNGGTAVDSTGVITYLTPNNSGANSSLYNQTYFKSINDLSALNNDTARNKIVVRHTTGNKFTDIIVTALLDYGEPSGQAAFDNTTTMSDTFVFDEIALYSWEGTAGEGKLLTHVIFHPVQKSLNRLIQIDYTVRIQSLTNFVDT
tara:strand:+ start:44142 stop:44753 length:612 start_codon:yes stop_codon:yes gene_type:complete